MRHEQIAQAGETREVHIAAAWPHLFEAIVATVPDAADEASALPEPAVPDVPAAVGGLVVGSYAALVAVLFAFMARSPLAIFSLVIVAGFVAIYFAVPILFLKVENDRTRRPAFSAFMNRGIATLTGRSGGGDALVQMLIVPVLLTLGLAAMGIIGRIYI